MTWNARASLRSDCSRRLLADVEAIDRARDAIGRLLGHNRPGSSSKRA